MSGHGQPIGYDRRKKKETQNQNKGHMKGFAATRGNQDLPVEVKMKQAVEGKKDQEE